MKSDSPLLSLAEQDLENARLLLCLLCDALWDADFVSRNFVLDYSSSQLASL
jgi:hypothetical protein